MAPELTLEAFDAESRRLSQVVAGAGDSVFARPTPCVPWTVAELVFHVQVGMGRLTGMLTAPEPDGTGLVAAADYFRADQRFSAAAGRAVRTRHGDRMLLTQFLRTRVLELAVHGLDLATALGFPPWMTDPAAQVTEELLAPAAAAAGLRGRAGWDRVTLVATLTGRRPASAAETQVIQSCGVQRLTLG